jgi:hypothetical protein
MVRFFLSMLIGNLLFLNLKHSFRFRYHLTHVRLPGSRIWLSKVPYRYADGTTLAPILLRDVPKQNYLPWGAKLLGFILLGFALAICFGNIIYIYVNRKHRVLTASQPIFLYQLCFGSALVVTSILSISFDENSGFSESQLSLACKSIPWFIIPGHIIQQMALFSKVR